MTMRPAGITRRTLLGYAVHAIPAARASPPSIEVPVLRIVNKHASCTEADIRNFNTNVWDEASRLFAACGIFLRLTDRTGEIRPYPSGRPRFFGLDRTMVNVVLTDRIPLDWDNGRSLAGTATLYEGCRLAIIALREAHPNRIPLIAVNTVVHELLHIFRSDIFERRDGLFHGGDREAAVDLQATMLWLFHFAPSLRESVRSSLSRRTTA